MVAIFAVYIIHPDWVYQSHKETPDILKSFLLIPQSTLPLHAVGWTLIHELWFYFIFCFILFAPKRWMPAILVAWALVVAFGSLAAQNPTPFIAIILHPLTLEFIMGAGVAIIIKNRKELPYGDVAAILGAVMLFFSFARVAGFAQDFFALKWDRVFYFGLPSAILLYGMVVMELDGAKAKKPLVHLGNWSYALYLIHVPVFAATGRVFAKFSREGVLDNLLFCVIAFVAAVIASAILHIAFEKPIVALAHKVFKK
jgi:peptidoglycan/LPS O-acetylase OafA/YrhL